MVVVEILDMDPADKKILFYFILSKGLIIKEKEEKNKLMTAMSYPKFKIFNRTVVMAGYVWTREQFILKLSHKWMIGRSFLACDRKRSLTMACNGIRRHLLAGARCPQGHLIFCNQRSWSSRGPGDPQILDKRNYI